MGENGDAIEAKEIIVKPDKIKLSELTDNIITLKEGEVLHVTHSFEIANLGGKKVAIDPIVEGQESLTGKVNPVGFAEALRSEKDINREYIPAIDAGTPTSLNEQMKSNSDRVGEGLGEHIDIILITHMDPDHFDFGLIRKMMETNPNLVVYGPLGWQKFLTESHSTPNVPDISKTEIPPDIWDRLRALSPQSAHPDVDPGLGTAYPGLSLDRIEYKSGGKNNKITSIEVPHTGTPGKVEYVQGFLLENEGERTFFIPDSSFSPEIMQTVSNLQTESPLTRIVISTAKYNPEPYGPVKDVRKADRLRTNVEEFIQHTAYLPIALYALTEGKVPIHINHGGFFYNTTTEKRYMAFRVPVDEKVGPSAVEGWIEGFKQKYDQVKERMKPVLDKLMPYSSSFGPQGRSEINNVLKDLPARFEFSRQFVDYIKNHPLPRKIFDDLDMPQANRVLGKSMS